MDQQYISLVITFEDGIGWPQIIYLLIIKSIMIDISELFFSIFGVPIIDLKIERIWYNMLENGVHSYLLI